MPPRVPEDSWESDGIFKPRRRRTGTFIRERSSRAAMALAVQDVVPLLPIALTFALAGWLLWLNFESRLNRAFALFLVLRGMRALCLRMAPLDPGNAEYWYRMSDYFFIALAPALLHFLLTYLWPRARWRAVATGVLVAGAALAEWANLRDPCLVGCAGPEDTFALGPLSLLGYVLPVGYALAGLVLAREALTSASPARRSASFLVASAFLLEALLEAAIVLGTIATLGWAGVSAEADPRWTQASYLLRASALPLAAAGVWLLARGALREAAPRRALLLGLLALAATATGLARATDLGVAWVGAAVSILGGLWRLLLPGAVVYAILRHSFFDLDLKLKWTLSKVPLVAAVTLALFLVALVVGTYVGGSLAGAVSGVAVGGAASWLVLALNVRRWRLPRASLFAALALAAFFVTTQIAESYLSTAYGAVLGGLATAIVMLALTPLQRMGERLANGMMPNAKPIDTLSHPERQALYRDHASLAWADGALARKERLLLDHLREQLGLSWEEAARLERQAMEGGTAGASS